MSIDEVAATRREDVGPSRIGDRDANATDAHTAARGTSAGDGVWTAR